MISAQNLTKKFGSLTAVDNISFEIPEGEIFGFLGPNGAGKTTTIRMLATLIAPTSGKILIDGRDARSNSDYIRNIVGILTETPGMYEKNTAYGNLKFFASFYKVEPSIININIEKFLKMFELWDRRNDLVITFSKGMKQKLAIARALIHEPKVLFLDEPTAALDPESAYMVRNFINNLRKEKITVFLSTHNLEEAQDLCNLVCIIKKRIIKMASLFELQNSKEIKNFDLGLKENPKKYISVFNKYKDKIQFSFSDNNVNLKIKDFEDINPLIIKDLVNDGAQILYFNENKESLENIYLELIKD
ncbi:MAG: ABC transporter ATP-binding protein [Cyanobacteria bacterium]|nr:ABC transporter ATP-binding protein [Cyanobacteriota bacterium]